MGPGINQVNVLIPATLVVWPTKAKRSGCGPAGYLACVLALSTVCCERSKEAAVPLATAKPHSDRPSVLLVTLDTTRADHLGCYGYAKDTSPNLDGFAAGGVLFTNAIAQASVTPVSHASILTGLNPYSHGLRVMHGRTRNRLADSQRTLAEVLRAAGYQTAAFVSAFPVTERFGLHQGFDHFDSDFMKAEPEQLVSKDGVVSTGRNQRRADETTDRALAWLASARSPYFVWIHYFDPHDPDLLPPSEVLSRYGKPGPTDTERDILRALYDIEIEYMDHHIGRVLDWLKTSGGDERTVVVVVADHGEGLGDHDWWTHGILYQEQIHVPLMMRGPAIPAGKRLDHLVRSIDIMPTILELVDLDPEARPAMDGRSLVACFSGSSADSDLTAYADSLSMLTYGFTERVRDVKDEMMLVIVRGPWKYIHHLQRSNESELFNLAADPDELVNVITSHRDVAERLRSDLMARQSIPESLFDDRELMSEEDIQRLRSLGYTDK